MFWACYEEVASQVSSNHMMSTEEKAVAVELDFDLSNAK